MISSKKNPNIRLTELVSSKTKYLSFSPKEYPNCEILDELPEGVNESSGLVVDLSSDEQKIHMVLGGSLFHIVTDEISSLAYLHETYPDATLVLVYLYTGERELVTKLKVMNYLQTILKIAGVKAEFVWIDRPGPQPFPLYVKAKNYFVVNKETSRGTVPTINQGRELLALGLDPSPMPFRKAYLSRKKVANGLTVHLSDENSFSPDSPNYTFAQRIDDSDRLEKYMIDKGFEIVYPEDFAGLKEQIEYMRTVRTLVSISGGGLINTLFMQPGQTVIELQTEIITRAATNRDKNVPFKDLVFEYERRVHPHFQELSHIAGQYHFSVSNDMNVDTLIERIENSPGLVVALNA